MPPLGIQI